MSQANIQKRGLTFETLLARSWMEFSNAGGGLTL